MAVAADVRAARSLPALVPLMDELRQEGVQIRSLFLDASTEALVRRFSETRRPHPLANAAASHAGHALVEANELESLLLGELREESTVVDTSLQSIMNVLRSIFRLIGLRGIAVPQGVGIAPVVLEGQDALMRVLQPAQTVRLRPAPEKAALPGAERTKRRELLWHGITDQGIARDQNEDSFALLDLGDQVLFVVADGMGGHDAGEEASRIAVETACSAVRSPEPHEDPLALVERAMQRANAEVKREGMQRGSNMGTTLTVALVRDDAAFIEQRGRQQGLLDREGLDLADHRGPFPARMVSTASSPSKPSWDWYC